MRNAASKSITTSPPPPPSLNPPRHPLPLPLPPLPPPHPLPQRVPIPTNMLGPEARDAAPRLVLDLDRRVGPAHQALSDQIDAVAHVRGAAHDGQGVGRKGVRGESGGGEEGVRGADGGL